MFNMTEPKTELERNEFDRQIRKKAEEYQAAVDRNKMDERATDKLVSRCLSLIKKQADIEKENQERTDHAAIVDELAKKERALAIEIAKVRHDETCELMRRHYLREREPSLRELTKKLQAGYIARDNKRIVKENEYKRLQAQLDEIKQAKALNESIPSQDVLFERAALEDMKKKQKYKEDLSQQMVNQQLTRQAQYEDSLIEKSMIEDINRTLAEEDRKEREQKQYVKEKLHQEMLVTQQLKEEWKRKHMEELIREEKDIEKQIMLECDRDAVIVEARRRKWEQQQAINKKITDQILANEADREERNEMIFLLNEQEQLEASIEQEKMLARIEVEKKRRTGIELRRQMEEKERERMNERVRSIELYATYDQMMAQSIEKEREKKRQKAERNKQYAIDLKKQLEDNKIKRQRDKEMEEQRITNINDHFKSWDQEVFKERQQIVKQHVPQLIGHMTANTLTKDDLTAVKDGLANNEQLAKLDLSTFGQSMSQPRRRVQCNPQCQTLRLW